MSLPIQNLESMLQESIKHFLTSYNTGTSDFSPFESIFFRLIQTMLDPPLEISWFYSAVTFHAAKLDHCYTPAARVLRVKDLLNLLISCSNLSSASKKIALLAPVVSELYKIIRDCRKGGRYVETEVTDLLDSIVNYVMISSGAYAYGEADPEIDSVVVCFEELVRVWVADRDGGTCGFEEILKVFFPLLTDGTWKAISTRCSIQELVGIVLCEVFFLRLYMTLSSGMHSDDMLKDIQNHVVRSTKGFSNFYLLDMILKMLLETRLPITDLLSSADDVLLHKALYDAVMLADYSFYSGSLVRLPDNRSKRFALVWVLVADRAYQLARSTSDEARATSYLNAFCNSHLTAELANWANIQAGTMNINTRSEISCPTALIKLLLLLEDHGVRIFNHSISAIHSTAASCISKSGNDSPELLHSPNETYISSYETDANKDQEMSDPSPTNDSPTSVSSISAKNEMGRKRKESLTGLHEHLPVKQIKLGFCGVEAKNVASDEDMELIG